MKSRSKQSIRSLWPSAALILLVILNPYVSSRITEDDCKFYDLTPAVASVVCSIERGIWTLPSNSSAILNAGCLLGADRCSGKRHVPIQSEVPASPPPPAAKNKQYQALATTAESVVPKTWWREGFANEQLLLTKSDSELPRKQFDGSQLRNKKLKNLAQCVTRQQFIRKSYDFDLNPEVESATPSKCTAMTDPSVKQFLELWRTGDSSTNYGGELKKEEKSNNFVWSPIKNGDGKLLVSALQVK